VTTVERTLIDLAAVLDDVQLETAIESARRQELTSLTALESRFATLRGPGRAGAKRLQRVLDVLDPRAPSEFPLEVLVANLLRDSGLPGPVPQFWIEVNGKRYRVDFAWPEVRLILECDGRAYHPDFEADRARWSALASDGWRIVFATWREVTRTPEVVVERVSAALQTSLTA
jgi:very-short-patch-repair endonuclease